MFLCRQKIFVCFYRRFFFIIAKQLDRRQFLAGPHVTKRTTSRSTRVYSNSVFTSRFPLSGIYSNYTPHDEGMKARAAAYFSCPAPFMIRKGQGQERLPLAISLTNLMPSYQVAGGAPCPLSPESVYCCSGHVQNDCTFLMLRRKCLIVMFPLRKKNSTLLSRLSRLIGFARRTC